MYTTKNFKTKKALKEHVFAYVQHKLNEAAGVPLEARCPEPVELYAPGLGSPKRDGVEFVEGPHFPAPHSWYAQVEMRDGVVVKVK